MRYIAAYLLAVLGGNESPSKSDVTAILSAGGIEVDQALFDTVYAQLNGKSLDELIAAGSKKFSALPSGGSAAPSSGSAPAASSGAAVAKKEEPKEVEEEVDMGFSLFD